MDSIDVFAVLGAALFIGAIVLLQRYLERKRVEQLRVLAAKLGLVFETAGGTSFAETFAHFPLLQAGHSPVFNNIIRGNHEGSSFWVFDFIYTVAKGKQQSHVAQTVFLLSSPQMRLPRFSMRPEGFSEKIRSAFGSTDIDFSTHRLFSDMFVLQGAREADIRRLFQHQLLNYFERFDAIQVEGCHHDLLFCRPRKRIKPDELKRFVDTGLDIARRFPRTAIEPLVANAEAAFQAPGLPVPQIATLATGIADEGGLPRPQVFAHTQAQSPPAFAQAHSSFQPSAGVQTHASAASPSVSRHADGSPLRPYSTLPDAEELGADTVEQPAVAFPRF